MAYKMLERQKKAEGEENVRLHYSSPKPAGRYTRVQGQDVLQRMIGFEFQTFGGNINILKLNTESPDHGEPLLSMANSVKLEADGSDLEYITEPVDENRETDLDTLGDNLTARERQFQTFVADASTVENMKTRTDYQGPVRPGEFANPFVTLPEKYNQWKYIEQENLHNFIVNPKGQKRAHPQSTVGVELKELHTLMKRATDIKKGENDRIQAYTKAKKGNLAASKYGHTKTTGNVFTLDFRNDGKAADQQAALFSAVAKAELAKARTDNAKGLITLLEQMITVQEEAERKVKDRKIPQYHSLGKNKMPVMPRTSPTKLFQLLTVEEMDWVIRYFSKYKKETIVAKETNGEETIRLSELLQSFRKARNAKTAYTNLGAAAKTRIAAAADDVFFDGRGTNRIQSVGITSALGPDAESDPTDIGGGRHGAFVELRALPNNVAPNEWKHVIQVVGGMLREVHRYR